MLTLILFLFQINLSKAEEVFAADMIFEDEVSCTDCTSDDIQTIDDEELQ